MSNIDFFRKIFLSVIIPIILSAGGNLHAQLLINEILASNDNTLQDADGDYSDWIEIYNPGTSTISLIGWSLTDEPSNPGKWAFPNISIASGHYLVLFASGKDRSFPGSELHTSFKLSGDGEYLALISPSGKVESAFSPAFPPQQADISYGIFNGSFLYFSSPTPGSLNLQSGSILSPPVMSVKHGLFDYPFNLEINTLAGESVYYTTNGSIPDISTGILYTGPITIDKTSIIRARSASGDQQSEIVATSSYIFPSDIITQTNNPAGFPSTWGTFGYNGQPAPADYEMDPELISNSEFANSVKEGLRFLPTLSIVTESGNLFSTSTDPITGGIYIYTAPNDNSIGRDWERPISFELFNSDATLSLQVDCGLGIHGGESRRPEKSPKHSFRIAFRSEYGPSRLEFPIFEESSNSSFNSLVLRAGFNNSWIHHYSAERLRSLYIQDSWIKDTHKEMGGNASNSKFANLYINGIYWGIYTPSERMDSDFAASYLEGLPEDFDVVKDYQEVVDGTLDDWNNLVSMANAGLTSDVAYQHIQGRLPDGSPDPHSEAMVDADNLADYMLVNFYAGNTDWDNHNWVAVRNRVNPGSGFTFLCWDAERTFESLNQNVVGKNNDNCPSRIFQQLKQNEQFRRLVGDKVQKYCFNGGLLTPDKVMERWLLRRDQIEKALPAESARWGDYRRDVHPYQTAGPFALYSYENHWMAEQDWLINSYFPARTDILVNQLRSSGLYPEIAAPQFHINGDPMNRTTISEGDILTMSSSQGIIYFTTSGVDPAIWEKQPESSTVTYISSDANKKILVPKSDLGTSWVSDLVYDDSSWDICTGMPGGIGYEKESGYESLISYDTSNDMYSGGNNPNNSCYIRIPFTVSLEELEKTGMLSLLVRYDDGFVAYLNGNRVADKNAPASCIWNSVSTTYHEAADEESIDISTFKDYLIEGENLLAIQCLNSGISSSDFLFTVQLKASEAHKVSNSPDAAMYTEAITLEHSGQYMARTFLNGEWSALSNLFFLIPDDRYDIKVTEVHYHPLAEDTIDESAFEFIELKNTGLSTLDIGGFSFSKGIDYVFPRETRFDGGEFIVLASDKSSFNRRYGFMPFGEFKGKLANSGEQLVISSSENDTLSSFMYYDNYPWPTEADGEGYSLVPILFNPQGNQSLATDWRCSFRIGGSPGEDDTISVQDYTKPILAENFELSQNYPNPFHDLTYIQYTLPEAAHIDMRVYNITGQQVATLESGQSGPGAHVVSWDGCNQSGNRLESGMYICRIVVVCNGFSWTSSRKLILMGN